MVKATAINTTGAGSGTVERLEKEWSWNPCLIKGWHSKNNLVIKIRW